MSVPNTSTFSIMDVITELGGGLTSLQACFTAANTSGFDPAYNQDNYAPANSMLRFRNYTHIIVVNFNLELIGRTTVDVDYGVTATLSAPAPSGVSIPVILGNFDGLGNNLPFSFTFNTGDSVRTASPGYTGNPNQSSFTATLVGGTLPAGYTEGTTDSITVPAV